MTRESATYSPRIGVKYCGGCNPFYDRGATVRKALANFPSASVESVVGKDCAEFDLIFVVLGCSQSECFDYKSLQGKYGQVIISKPEDSAKIIQAMNDLFSNQKKERES